MTQIASMTLAEALARALADAIGEHPLLSEHSLDLSELGPDRWKVGVYFVDGPGKAERAALDAVATEVAGKSAGRFAVDSLPDVDWVTESLKGLAPVRAGCFLVHGAHDRAALRPNDIGIEIEAGLAFGTGHHGTTAGCLIAIDRLAKERPVRNALDLGTGSGVLAIGIAKRTKAPVVASDIDPVAVKVAADNVRLNGEAARIRTVVAAGMESATIARHAPYDLIVANILAGPLVTLAPAIRKHLAPGGVVILSGLLTDQQRRVAAAYRGQGLTFVRSGVIDDWVTLVFRR